MANYRVFANFLETREVWVEADSEQEARDKAYEIDYDEWNLFACEFDGDEVELMD